MSWIKWRHVFAVYRKELVDTLRDRRSLISMFLIPTVVIPGLMLGLGMVSYKVIRKVQQEVPTVMIVGAQDSPAIRAALDAHQRVKIVPYADDYAQRIEDKRLRVAVEIPADFDAVVQAGGTPPAVIIYSYQGEVRSEAGRGEVERFFNVYREKILQGKLAAEKLPSNFLRVFELKRKNVAPPEKVGGATVGGIIPYLLILLSFTGAMYPALDLTAGEKERGTMETILCSPVGRLELVLGKFFMILSASLMTVLCSLLSLLATGWIGMTLLGKQLANAGANAAASGGGLMSVSIPGVLAVCVLMLPLAVLFSSVLFSVALCAKSYKEAQSYVSPLIFIVILPAVVGMLPGVELNNTMALIPLVNVSLLCKELVAGNFPMGTIVLIFCSTCVYAGLALAVAVRMFKREDVIFRV